MTFYFTVTCGFTEFHEILNVCYHLQLFGLKQFAVKQNLHFFGVLVLQYSEQSNHVTD